jgi:hypothetical protein
MWLRLCRTYLASLRRRAQARTLAGLDARTLKDIGLEAQAEEQRRRALMRLVSLRLGSF